MQQERGLTMLTHSVVIGVVAYLVMVYGLKQSARVAENRSLVFASVVLIYMVTIGHKLPSFFKLK